MKKLLAVLLILSLSAVCLAGCAGGGVKNSPADIAAAVESAAGLVNASPMDDDEMIYTMAVTMDNVETYAGSYSNSVGASGTVLVIKAKSGKADSVKTELETYQSKNADLLSTYTEFATASQQAKDGRIVVKGDVIVLAIAGPDADYAAVDTAIEGALQ